MDTPETLKRLRHDIRADLLDRIVNGRLKAGERVNEVPLARQLKVSRTPLREALLQLERDGFTRSDVRRGFAIEKLSAHELREIYPMIWTLEGLALRSSAAFAHLLVPELTRINSQLAIARHPRRAIALDTRWHETLIGQSSNRRLAATIAGLRLAARRYELVYMADTALLAESVVQHGRVIEALKKRDIDAAQQALEANWRFGMQALLKEMGEEP